MYTDIPNQQTQSQDLYLDYDNTRGLYGSEITPHLLLTVLSEMETTSGIDAEIERQVDNALRKSNIPFGKGPVQGLAGQPQTLIGGHIGVMVFSGAELSRNIHTVHCHLADSQLTSFLMIGRPGQILEHTIYLENKPVYSLPLVDRLDAPLGNDSSVSTTGASS